MVTLAPRWAEGDTAGPGVHTGFSLGAKPLGEWSWVSQTWTARPRRRQDVCGFPSGNPFWEPAEAGI